MIHVTLARKVAALRDPAAHAEATTTVEALETHMSWVFLTDRHAYKLKKPVRYDGLDFRSLAARRFYCQEELRLNRVLAPSVYLDVVPLVACDDGRLRVAGAGAAVDWLVKMRRLPAHAMLDALLERRAATPAQMLGVAQRLAAFHQGQPSAPLDAAGYRALLLRRIDEYCRELCDPVGALPRERVAALCERQRKLLDARLAIRHLREARYRGSPAWRRRAMRYLALAERHLRACEATVGGLAGVAPATA